MIDTRLNQFAMFTGVATIAEQMQI